ncbi:uncharacterized protein BCR38DRAFT_483701 [Pseudomassariella vexata]|uniref:DUF7707 domain-containing protein n=1 Tax=Pseudomassariella vexata TaxID=1141098 RepID=A0A1Y2E3C3_9PEZI|nr:uncharacterized protein BCR38DRAFT_483701 [Pseudomassariella vexata]ORY66043.1 hypothetical protein BCR38DRAFT_483701 [Pseudomassariella vexata]
MIGRTITVITLSALTVSATTNFTIDPTEVALSTRAAWCQSEINVCNQVCSDAASTNACDPELLTYDCTCTDGTTPDVSEYRLSLPFYICQQAQTDCVNENAGNLEGLENCTTTIQDNCGTKNASDATTASTTSSASSSATATGGAATSATSATASATSTAGAMPNIQHLGHGAAAVAFGLFAYML